MTSTRKTRIAYQILYHKNKQNYQKNIVSHVTFQYKKDADKWTVVNRNIPYSGFMVINIRQYYNDKLHRWVDAEALNIIMDCSIEK